MNKRGTDKALSVYWFAILFIVAGGIVYMTFVFYGAPYDVREIEANVLINQVADCIATGGKLNDNWVDLNNDNFLQRCHFNFKVEDVYGWKDNQFYVEINSYDFKTDSGIYLDSKNEQVKFGDSGLNQSCITEGKYSPVCIERSFYVLEGDVSIVIKIKSVIGKADKNA